MAGRGLLPFQRAHVRASKRERDDEDEDDTVTTRPAPAPAPAAAGTRETRDQDAADTLVGTDGRTDGRTDEGSAGVQGRVNRQV